MRKRVTRRRAAIGAAVIVVLGILILATNTEESSTPAAQNAVNVNDQADPSDAQQESAQEQPDDEVAVQQAEPAESDQAADAQQEQPIVQAEPLTLFERSAACMDAWDGNHNGFERQIRERLHDEGSMQTHSTQGDHMAVPVAGRRSSEMLIYMVYSANNQWGARVKTEASGWLDVETCEVEVTSYGFDQ